MSEQASAVLALWNDVDPACEAAYEDWHAHEHVPERCTVPGILWGWRWRRRDTAAAPRYFTLYGLREPAVLQSPAYLRLLSHPSPASQRMRPALRHLSRWVCTLAPQPEGAGTTPASDLARTLAGLAQAPACTLWTGPNAPLPAAGALQAQRLPDAAPLPWLTASNRPAADPHPDHQWLQLQPGLATAGPTQADWLRLPVGPRPAG